MKPKIFLKAIIKTTFIFVLCICIAASVPVGAASYTFDSDGNAVYSPNIYNHWKTISGTDIGCGDFSDLSDIFVDSKDRSFILDSGAGRIILLDDNYRLLKIIDSFTYNGKPETLANPQGLFYHETFQKIYIGDTGNDRIVVSDIDGKIEKFIYKPETELIDASLHFSPTKLIVDNLGIIFVKSANVNTGLIMIFDDGSFGGFYGANTIKETADVLQEFVWRKIFSYSSNKVSESYQTTELNNVFWDEKERCIYAVSPSGGTASADIVKLNATGDNLLSSTEFGDESVKGQNFIDITLDSNGLFCAIDSSTGKIYQYDQNCNLLGVFGGIGYTEDVFSNPVSIESNSKSEILVLDSKKKNLIIFRQTTYCKTLQNALQLYNDGQYIESAEKWEAILRENANLYSAHIGMARAYVQMGDYETAMTYFRNGKDSEGYSEAKGLMLSEWLKNNFAVVAIAVVAVFIIIYFYSEIKNGISSLRNRRRHKG